MTVPKGFLIDQRIILQWKDDREMNSHTWHDVRKPGELEPIVFNNMNEAKTWLSEESASGRTYRIARVSDELETMVVEARQFVVGRTQGESAIIVDDTGDPRVVPPSDEPEAETPDEVVVAQVADDEQPAPRESGVTNATA